MKELKKKYVRRVIKLGNSFAMTFPQDWTQQSNLKEKSEVVLYPIDNNSIVIKTSGKDKQKTVLNIDSNNWPIPLIRHALISAFKLNVDEIFIKYKDENQEKIFALLIDMRGEMIGMAFKEIIQENKYYIYFLLDTSKTTFKEELLGLIEVFDVIIKNVIEGSLNKNSNLLLTEIDRKYALGRRILITGLSEYPISKGYRNFPVIRYLGDRVVLLKTRDFINEALNLGNFPSDIIKKYSDLLSRIPSLLVNIIENYDNINLETISSFHDYLIKLSKSLEKIKIGETFEELELRNTIKYFLNSFQAFFDIGMTRLIESEIGMI